jgi:CRP-like cAMP-binding protein
MIEKILNNPLFKSIKIDDLFLNLAHLDYQIKTYTKNSTIALCDDVCDRLMIILEGEVRGEMISPDGKVVKVEDMQAPHALASIFLFGKANHFPVNVVANSKTIIAILPKASVLELMKRSSKFLENYLDFISNKAVFLTKKIKLISFASIKQKIAHFILSEAGEYSKTIKLNQSKQQLADLFGVARPSLSRVLGEMEKDGIIAVDKREISILDRHGLKEIMKTIG